MGKETCGVYQIENTITGDKYIGGSKNLNKRISEHFSMFRGGYHHARMQAEYNKYGGDAFKSSVLVVCEIYEVNRYEVGLMKRMKPSYNTKNYVEPRKDDGTCARGRSAFSVGTPNDIPGDDMIFCPHCGKRIMAYKIEQQIRASAFPTLAQVDAAKITEVAE